MAIIQNLEAFVQSYPAGLDSVTDLQLSQNENGRQIRFTIGGVTIPAGSVATISGTKPDGVVYSNTGTIEGSDTVIFDEDVQMTAVFGTWYAKIRITNAGNTIASARMRFIIDKDPVDAGAIPSESQLNGLVAEAEEYAGAAEDAAERAAITYGSPLTAATASAMTDINRVYVYTGSESGYTYGNWYYYNGSAWVSGGVYNSAAVETDTTLTESGVPADAKATGDKIDELKDDLSHVEGISDAVKVTLLDCFAHVAWIDEHGQDYYDALERALYALPYPNITAVFSPGSHVVYTDDTIDSLKQYLVVTYYETEESQGVVLSSTDYTLSGSLVEGENTIIVRYNSLYTAFEVNAVDYYNIHEWSVANGLLGLITMGNAGTTWFDGVGRYPTVVDWSAARRGFYAKRGTHPYRLSTDYTVIYNNMFPIPVPDDATTITVSVTPATQYFGGVICSALEDGKVNGNLAIFNWTQGTGTITLPEGTNRFYCPSLKYDNAGKSYPVNPTEFVVTFS